MDDAMLLVLLLFGIVILARVVTYLVGPDPTTERMGKIASSCPPHKWSLHPVTNKHQCTECNYVAGTHKTEHGEY